VQALTARSTLAYPRRTADGADLNRVNLLLAVLERRLGLRMSEADVYVNIAGGVRLREPAVDLGIVTALLSSFKDIVIDEKTMVFGEVGLSGEVRSVSQAPLRVREAQTLGFTTVILPQACLKAVGKAEGVRLIGVRSVRDLISALTQS
jgi:DNA repair protein RadA/Sms